VATSLSQAREHRRELRRLGELLAAARREQGLRQVDLAERLNRSQSYVAKFEVGERRLDIVELAVVCQALGLDAADFTSTFIGELRIH
jgi:transcriptional regulator with XRE-family HTH domain